MDRMQQFNVKVIIMFSERRMMVMQHQICQRSEDVVWLRESVTSWTVYDAAMVGRSSTPEEDCKIDRYTELLQRSIFNIQETNV